MKKLTLSVLLALSVLAGCAQRHIGTQEFKSHNVAVVSYPTELRGAYILPSDGKAKFCAEPAPDIALESLYKMKDELKVTVPKGADVAASMDNDLSNKVIELAGRNDTLLLAREFLYRLCELSLNRSTIGNNELLVLYGQVVDSIKSMADAHKADAETQKKKAEAKLLEEQTALENAKKHLNP